MKKFLFILGLFFLSWSCHTPMSCVERHPENYINKGITVNGYAQDWLKDFHGFYFIVLTNRNYNHHIIVYKQMPSIRLHQRIKATGHLLKAKTRNRNTVYILLDTNNYTFKIQGDSGKIAMPLRFRDTLPTLLWFKEK